MKTAGTCRESSERWLYRNRPWSSITALPAGVQWSQFLSSNRQHVLESVILGKCNAPALANVSPVNTAAIKFQEKFTEPRFKAKNVCDCSLTADGVEMRSRTKNTLPTENPLIFFFLKAWLELCFR